MYACQINLCANTTVPRFHKHHAHALKHIKNKAQGQTIRHTSTLFSKCTQPAHSKGASAQRESTAPTPCFESPHSQLTLHTLAQQCMGTSQHGHHPAPAHRLAGAGDTSTGTNPTPGPDIAHSQLKRRQHKRPPPTQLTAPAPRPAATTGTVPAPTPCHNSVHSLARHPQRARAAHRTGRRRRTNESWQRIESVSEAAQLSTVKLLSSRIMSD